MRKTGLTAALLASSAITSAALAQTETQPPSTSEPPVAAGAPGDQTDASEDIIVTGIRASQARSIDIKRDAIAIVDAISAEDIGKLPDVTIVDSLQRISGVQILRNAGEGSTVNIRGLPQVVTLLNGEQYLSPANLGAFEPNLNDVPAQLMGGVVVFKSQDLRNAISGITGTIDLRTRRPFDFGSGLTLSAQGEVQTGEDTREPDFMTSGLVSWRQGSVGIMATAAYSDLTLGNNYSGSGGGQFLNNDWGGDGDNWIAPHGFEVFAREVERKRFGASAAIQWEIDDGITLTGEGFYTKFIEHDLRAGMNISNRWVGLGWTSPATSTTTGITGPNGQPVLNIQDYNLDAWWVNSFSVNRTINSESKNFNLELDYDRGGPFTLTTRAVYADADYLNTNGQVQGDLSNWQFGADRTFTLFREPADRTRGTFYPANIAADYAGQYSNSIVGSRGGRYVTPNPQGYGSDPQLTLTPGQNNFAWGGFDRPIGGGLGPNSSLRDYMSNEDSYTVAAYSSEGNNRNASDFLAVRVDGAYDFEKGDGALFGIVRRIDAGVRSSRRRTQIEVYHLFSNLYAGNGASNPNGCAVQWKAIDVVLNNTAGCTAGEQVPNPAFNPALPVSASNPQTVFQGYTAYRPTKLGTNNNTYFLDDFGSVTSGFPGIWVADPRDFNDPQEFQERVFGNAFPVIIPGASYDVDFYEQSAYATADLEIGPVRANAGLKVIRSRSRVRQNLTGATIPYGDTNEDVGDVFDGRSYWDYLPTVNAQWDITDQLRLRASFAKTMIPLALGSYGSGLSIATNDAPCEASIRQPTDAPCGQRQVTSASSSGNPDLNPWRSDNYDLTIEYYIGQASLVNAGYFRLDVASFVSTQTLTDGEFPDSDGVIRRTVPFTRPIQGEGGKIDGFEFNAKLAASDFIDTPILRNFGIDANYTLADSEQRQNAPARDGRFFAFNDYSRDQINAALWYQDAKLQTRIAYNRRSPRLQGQVQGIPIKQDTTNYVDLNVTYAFNDMFQIYGNVSNLTGEIERYFYEFEEGSEQTAWFNEFERRVSAGVRVRF